MNVKTKTKSLTDAQIYTLRRMNSGTKYSLRGDGKKGQENRPEIAVQNGTWFNTFMPYNAPSIPVLYRAGLVEFTLNRGQESVKFYRVQLTEAGREAAATLKVKAEQ